LLGSSGSGSRCKKSLIRVFLYVTASSLFVGDRLVKASAVRVAGLGACFCEHEACERDAFDLGGRIGFVR